MRRLKRIIDELRLGWWAFLYIAFLLTSTIAASVFIVERDIPNDDAVVVLAIAFVIPLIGFRLVGNLLSFIFGKIRLSAKTKQDIEVKDMELKLKEAKSKPPPKPSKKALAYIISLMILIPIPLGLVFLISTLLFTVCFGIYFLLGIEWAYISGFHTFLPLVAMIGGGLLCLGVLTFCFIFIIHICEAHLTKYFKRLPKSNSIYIPTMEASEDRLYMHVNDVDFPIPFIYLPS